MPITPTSTDINETQVRFLIENWAAAVRNRDREAIFAHHSPDMVMFDVPEPLQSIGIEAYQKTWEPFFANTKSGVFDFKELNIVADQHAAFCFAIMKCADKSSTADYVELDFRFSAGLKKIDGQWTIVHEHHSVPAKSPGDGDAAAS